MTSTQHCERTGLLVSLCECYEVQPLTKPLTPQQRDRFVAVAEERESRLCTEEWPEPVEAGK